jgi:hypothetical protein
MSAIATEKVQTNSLNLGFPDVYASVYASKGLPLRYFPSPYVGAGAYVGDEEVNSLRLSRKAEADAMANAKVASTVSARNRYVTSPHGSGYIPKAVLGQRKFANPSTGAMSMSSARQSFNEAPYHFVDSEQLYSQSLSGGVLRTREGQIYGKKVLTERIGQLDKIDNAKAQVGQPPVNAKTGPLPGGQTETEQNKIQLDLILQQLSDGVDSAVRAVDQMVVEEARDEDDAEADEEEDEDEARMRIREEAQQIKSVGSVVNNLAERGYSQIYQLLRLVFQLAPIMGENDLNSVNERVLGIADSLDEVVGNYNDILGRLGEIKTPAVENILTIQSILTRIASYLGTMIDSVTKSDSERMAVSNNLIKSLKFGKDLKRTATPFLTGLLSTAEQDQIRQTQNDIYQSAEVAPPPPAVRESLPTGREVPRLEASGRVRRGKGLPSVFSRRGQTREDSETNVARGSRRFTPSAREAFGYASGEWYKDNGRGSATYFSDPSGVNKNGPGYEAISKITSGMRLGKTFDKTTGGYNVMFK